MAQTSEFYTKAKVDELLGAVDMANIVDSNGHNRFVEFNISVPEGVTQRYGKVNLSGGHLIIVEIVDLPTNVEVVDYSEMGYFQLPLWLANKIITMDGQSTGSILRTTAIYSAPTIFATQRECSIYLTKVNNQGFFSIRTLGSFTPIDTNTSLRIQIDLLIDSE